MKSFVKILLTVATVLMIAYIFSNSMQDSTQSGGESLSITKTVQQILVKAHCPVTVTDHIIRKTAHFTEYTILGILLLSTLRSYTHKIRKCLFIIIGIGVFTPLIDESIQLFFPGRSCQISDMLLDMCGVTFGLLLAWLVMKKLFQKNEKYV